MDPRDYAAINVSLYGPGRKKTWVFSEYSRSDVEQSSTSLRIGKSRLVWDADELRVELDERTANNKSDVRGTIRITPEHVYSSAYDIDAPGKHTWWPIAPSATIDVNLSNPELNFKGRAYLDSNRGEEPLERAFHKWTWARFETQTGTTVVYDTVPRAGEPTQIALAFSHDGTVEIENVANAPIVRLPRTFVWAFARETRCAKKHRPKILKTFEESPFYARSWVQTSLDGKEQITGVHESLSLDRFETPWMQWMLPYRIRRVEGR